MTSTIDIARLAGVNSYLGLEFSDSGVRIVELMKHGSMLNRFKCRFTVRASESVVFSPEEDREARGNRIGLALEKQSIKTRRAIIGIPSSHTKTAEVALPASVENVDEWIVDHLDEVLRLPISLADIRFAYQLIQDRDARRARVAFVRKHHLDDLREICKHAGLEVAGIRLPASDRDVPQLVGSIHGLAEQDRLPALLALHGFFPGSFDFLTGEERAAMEASKYKSLFQRTVIAAGSVLMFLLLIPFLAVQILNMREAAIEEQILAMGPAYSEIKLLEQQVETLRAQASQEAAGVNRSDVSRLSYGLAKSAPEGLWFLKVNVSESAVRIIGYARSSDQIATFMRNIQRDRVGTEVSLVRTEHSTERKLTMSVKNIPSTAVAFELKMTP
jgi:Tfp pilus assembly protein PilN